MIEGYTAAGYEYKLACDGFDLSRTAFGKRILNPIAVDYVKKHCIVDSIPNIEDFAEDCIKARRRSEPEHPLPISLRDKYEVGYFVTSPDNCFDSDYILFNQEQLDFWSEDKTDLYGLKFLVCVSRNWEGAINALGFRIFDTKRVHNAFKWLFPLGQRATFGLHLCDPKKQLILCEGAWDAYAFLESGVKNIVGLGAVKPTALHRKELGAQHLTRSIRCQDMDRYGMQMRQSKTKYCFYAPEGKDPFDAWLEHGNVDLVYLEG